MLITLLQFCGLVIDQVYELIYFTLSHFNKIIAFAVYSSAKVRNKTLWVGSEIIFMGNKLNQRPTKCTQNDITLRLIGEEH